MNDCYTISGPDNDSYMCASTDWILGDVQSIPICPQCGFKTDPFYINSTFRLTRRTYDLSFTYDNYCIVSLKFKEACNRLGITGVEFLALPLEPTFFVLRPTTTTEFDVARRKTRFEQCCSMCNFYKSVAGATPAFLSSVPSTDISGTDVLFGSGNERHPLLIATQRAKNLLSTERLKGINFKMAYL